MRDWVLLLAEVGLGAPPYFRRPLKGIPAYECYQSYHYLKQILALRNGESSSIDPALEYVVAAMAALKGPAPIQVVDIGSSVFGRIDMLDLVLSRFPDDLFSRDAIEYWGVEVDEFMNGLAAALHQGRPLSLTDRWRGIPDSSRRVGLGVQATSYALNDTAELVEWTASCRVALQGIQFNADQGDRRYHRCGQDVVFFDMDAFVAGMSARGHRVSAVCGRTVRWAGYPPAQEVFVLTNNLDEDEIKAAEAVLVGLGIDMEKSVIRLGNTQAVQKVRGVAEGYSVEASWEPDRTSSGPGGSFDFDCKEIRAMVFPEDENA